MTNSGITRRRILRSAATGGLAVAAASGAIGAARAQSARKTFVFVSGAFCGGWIWRRVTDRLEQGGHKVLAPSLTGLAERSHLLSKDVNLETHIADVVNLIKWESLENVCLVAWSYAGFVGAGALEKFPQPAFDKALADCKGNKSWATFELPDIGHMSMLDAPDRTSELILQGA
jgi:pimeloyl-ACP methyl ester carboxylesterase